MSHYPVGFLARRGAATGSSTSISIHASSARRADQIFPRDLILFGTLVKVAVAGFSLGAQSVRPWIIFRKVPRHPTTSEIFLHFGRERDRGGGRAARIGDVKKRMTETDTQKERERETESSLMLYRAVRPTGFGPLSRFWNPSIDPLVTSGSCLHPFRVLLSQRWIQAGQRDRSSA